MIAGNNLVRHPNSETGSPSVLLERLCRLDLTCFALWLVGFLYASYPGVLLGMGTFFRGDFGQIVYPNATYMRQCFWDGEVPFWNPYSGGGMPFLGSWFSTLYPPVLLYLLLPLKSSLANYCLLHLCWSGIGMYVLARQWTNNNLAAALAGIVFAFNGMTIGALQWPGIIATQSWMPWIVWAVGRAAHRGGRWILIAIVFGSLQMLTGGAENILLTWIGAGFLSWTGSKRPMFFPIHAARLILIILLISALAAIQLIPFFDFLQHSNRAYSVEEEQAPMPGWGWANLILPLFNCIPGRYGSTTFPVYCVTNSYYCGCVAVLAFLGSLLMLRRKCIAWTIALSILCAVMALGTNGFLFSMIVDHMPQFNVSRYPVKYFFLGTFALALLTACFVVTMVKQDHRFDTIIKSRVLTVAFAFYLVAAVVLVWFQNRYPYNEGVRNFLGAFTVNTAARLIMASLTLVFLLGLTKAGSLNRRMFLTLLLLTSTWLDLITAAPRGTITIPAGVYEPGIIDLRVPPVLGQGRLFVNRNSDILLMVMPHEDPLIEMACKRKGVSGSLNLLDGYGKFIGNESLYFPHILEVYKWLDVRTNLGSLGDFCGIRYYTTPDNLYSWRERTNAMPFINIGLEPIFTNRVGAINALYNEVNSLHDHVYLPEECRGWIRATRNREARIMNPRVERHRIQFEVIAPRESLVTIAQSHYPAWRAKIDGTNSVLVRANHAFQAIEVPPGRHSVELFYRDQGFLKGLCLSFPVLIGMVFLSVRSRFQTRA